MSCYMHCVPPALLPQTLHGRIQAPWPYNRACTSYVSPLQALCSTPITMAAITRASNLLLLPAGQHRVSMFTPAVVARGASIRARAEGDSSTTAAPVTYAPVAPIEYVKDTETIGDVFAFAGSLPERLNGRVAMWSFANLALHEFSTHTPAAQQFANDWGSAILLSLLLFSASLAPKFSSGVPLRDLHAVATKENMPDGGLSLFDGVTELWVGRVAMIGVAGLLITEAIRGDALF